jgi:Na+/H+-translocating membrane pyrophosphatase
MLAALLPRPVNGAGLFANKQPPIEDQKMSSEFLLILCCGVLALLYGIITGRQVLSSSAGTPRMQEIASAIQEGAKAYLNRQYFTIGIVGVVICAILAVFLGIQIGRASCRERVS